MGLYLEWRLTLVAGVFFPLMFFSISYERKSVQQETQATQKLLEKSVQVRKLKTLFFMAHGIKIIK